MRSPFKHCRACGDNEPSAQFRNDAHAVLCAECHLDYVRGVEDALHQLDSSKDDATLFSLSPAALAALAALK